MTERGGHACWRGSRWIGTLRLCSGQAVPHAVPQTESQGLPLARASEHRTKNAPWVRSALTGLNRAATGWKGTRTGRNALRLFLWASLCHQDSRPYTEQTERRKALRITMVRLGSPSASSGGQMPASRQGRDRHRPGATCGTRGGRSPGRCRSSDADREGSSSSAR